MKQLEEVVDYISERIDLLKKIHNNIKDYFLEADKGVTDKIIELENLREWIVTNYFD